MVMVQSPSQGNDDTSVVCNHTYPWSYYLPRFGEWLEHLHGCRSVGERPWMYVVIFSFT